MLLGVLRQGSVLQFQSTREHCFSFTEKEFNYWPYLNEERLRAEKILTLCSLFRHKPTLYPKTSGEWNVDQRNNNKKKKKPFFFFDQLPKQSVILVTKVYSILFEARRQCVIRTFQCSSEKHTNPSQVLWQFFCWRLKDASEIFRGAVICIGSLHVQPTGNGLSERLCD